MPTVRVSIASDYAVLEVGNLRFYFGYEYGRTDDGDEIWGFRAKKNSEVLMEYPVSEGKFEVTERLLEGLGKFIHAHCK